MIEFLKLFWLYVFLLFGSIAAIIAICVALYHWCLDEIEPVRTIEGTHLYDIYHWHTGRVATLSIVLAILVSCGLFKVLEVLA